ncbi:MAG: hypothetical protein IKD94_03760 [Erysipelotrichaceae bacterium]|nr:hypothetical protein [Erysipelotrichaceae bacterium]
MKKNNVVKLLGLLALLSYVTAVFVIADKNLWLGAIPFAVGTCLSWLALKISKETEIRKD